jgi:hypothetical protein
VPPAQILQNTKPVQKYIEEGFGGFLIWFGGLRAHTSTGSARHVCKMYKKIWYFHDETAKYPALKLFLRHIAPYLKAYGIT